MKFKVFLLLILFFLTGAFTADVSNGYIGECYLTNSADSLHPDDGETMTLICVEEFVQIDMFDLSATSRCSKDSDFIKNQITRINFENCTLSNIGKPIFEVYENVMILNATYIGLTSLQKELFRAAKKLTTLNVSHNEIVELSSFMFVNAQNLKEADFSFNVINRIDPFTFAGDSKMEMLNLAHNNITELHKQFFDYLPNLRHLNLSNNNITTLEENIFNNLTNLEFLDLSNNEGIEELSVNIFASLKKLHHLNISHANILEIRPKTFCRLEELEVLDLSFNKLKVLDVSALDGGIFLPKFDHLKQLYIGGNQLNKLDGFSSSRFPVTKFIGIPDNSFQCCYLIKLFRKIGWKQLDVKFDENSNQPNISDSNGVKCNFANDFIYNVEPTHFTWFEVLTIICILLLSLLFVMVCSIMKRNQHIRHNQGTENITVHCDSISNFDNPNVYDVPKF